VRRAGTSLIRQVHEQGGTALLRTTSFSVKAGEAAVGRLPGDCRLGRLGRAVATGPLRSRVVISRKSALPGREAPVAGGALLVALRVEELGRVRFRFLGASVDSRGVVVRGGSTLDVGTLGHKDILPHTEFGLTAAERTAALDETGRRCNVGAR
jgi:hypothetical protein